MASITYDALIVGSGITGGWAAKELTEKGLNVLVLEAGRGIVPERDYVEHVPVWELKFRDWDDRAQRQRTQFIQRQCDYACDEFSHQFFVSDLENPYSTDPGKTIFLDSRTSGWGKVHHLGSPKLSLERSGFRSECERRDWGGLAIRYGILLHGMTTWKSSPESAGKPRDCPNCRTANFCRRWK